MESNILDMNGPAQSSGDISGWSAGNGGTWNLSGDFWIKQ